MQEEIGEWTLSIDELSFVLDHREEVHFAMAVVLKHLQLRGAYPGETFVLDEEIIEYLSHQVHRPRQDYDAIVWTNRRMRRLHEKARIFLGLRHPGDTDRIDVRAWLETEVLPSWPTGAEVLKRARRWFASNRLFEPGPEFLRRIVQTARKDFEDAYLKEVHGALDPTTRRILEDSFAFPTDRQSSPL